MTSTSQLAFSRIVLSNASSVLGVAQLAGPQLLVVLEATAVA